MMPNMLGLLYRCIDSDGRSSNKPEICLFWWDITTKVVMAHYIWDEITKMLTGIMANLDRSSTN